MLNQYEDMIRTANHGKRFRIGGRSTSPDVRVHHIAETSFDGVLAQFLDAYLRFEAAGLKVVCNVEESRLEGYGEGHALVAEVWAEEVK